jgi:hypothetical protein
MDVNDSAAQRRQWLEQGYNIFRGVITADEAHTLRLIADDVLAQFRQGDPNPNPGGDSPHVIRHINNPFYFKGQHERLLPLLELAADERIITPLRNVMNWDPMYCKTSLWFNPLSGSDDGNWHRDTQFYIPDEKEERETIERVGVQSGAQLQVALVPSQDIQVVPGSHLRWDTPAEYAIRRGNGFANNTSNEMPGALRVDLAPGDAVIFNPLGLHRGRYHSDKLRRTIMLTYGRSGGGDSWWARQPWFLSPGYLDGVRPSTRVYYERFIAEHQEYWRAHLAGAAV